MSGSEGESNTGDGCGEVRIVGVVRVEEVGNVGGDVRRDLMLKAGTPTSWEGAWWEWQQRRGNTGNMTRWRVQ